MEEEEWVQLVPMTIIPDPHSPGKEYMLLCLDVFYLCSTVGLYLGHEKVLYPIGMTDVRIAG